MKLDETFFKTLHENEMKKKEGVDIRHWSWRGKKVDEKVILFNILKERKNEGEHKSKVECMKP